MGKGQKISGCSPSPKIYGDSPFEGIDNVYLGCFMGPHLFMGIKLEIFGDKDCSVDWSGLKDDLRVTSTECWKNPPLK